MTKHAAADIRNVVLLGHGDAGKTTLADHLMVKAGAVTRLGSVKEKTSFFDFDAEEKERGHSIDSTLGHFPWKGKHVNLIDTPGYPEFIGEAVGGINGADLGIVCVNAHSGVMVNTRRTWAMGAKKLLPRAIVVTKLDQSHDLPEVLGQIQKAFGKRCIPWRAPQSVGDFSSQWMEAVVEADEKLMERYLEEGEVPNADLERTARAAVLKRTVIPVLFVCAEKDQGMDTVLDLIDELGPAPGDLPFRVKAPNAEGPGDPVNSDPAGPFLGYVWKLQVDRHVGKIAHLRVIRGSIKPGEIFHNLRADTKEKCGHIFQMQGKEQAAVDAAVSGDLVVLTKIESLRVGDTLSHGHENHLVVSVPYPNPMYSLAVFPKSRGDEAKISEALHKTCDESPTFRSHREVATHEQIISGMSQLHLDMMLKRVRDRFGVEVETKTPKVPYKESVTVAAKGHYRHKKQTGGRGQFAEVYLSIEPGEPGTGLTYSWDIFGGSIPRNFEPAIEKGVREKMVHGIIAGYPIEDVKVSVTDGKYHDVDSSEAAFKMAGGRAFAEAVAAARPVILEPVVKIEIHIPGVYMGDVSGDLNTRRARIQGMDQDEDLQVIKAEMPQSEAAEYSRALTSITSGEGSYTVEPSHYEPVPGSVQQQLIAGYRPRVEED